MRIFATFVSFVVTYVFVLFWIEQTSNSRSKGCTLRTRDPEMTKVAATLALAVIIAMSTSVAVDAQRGGGGGRGGGDLEGVADPEAMAGAVGPCSSPATRSHRRRSTVRRSRLAA